jgi:hypothetical protein
MANLRITKTTPWTAADGSKHKQVEIMLCKIEKEDADWVEYSVTEVESINNAPSFYAPTTGGAVSRLRRQGWHDAGLKSVIKYMATRPKHTQGA